jgi:hypothetical protein
MLIATSAWNLALVMIIQDAMAKSLLPKILDNMIDERRLPVMIAIFVASGGGDGKGSERGLEYDTLSDLAASRREGQRR